MGGYNKMGVKNQRRNHSRDEGSPRKLERPEYRYGGKRPVTPPLRRFAQLSDYMWFNLQPLTKQEKHSLKQPVVK